MWLENGKIAELIISYDKSVIAAMDVIPNDRIITMKRPINKLFSVEFSN